MFSNSEVKKPNPPTSLYDEEEKELISSVPSTKSINKVVNSNMLDPKGLLSRSTLRMRARLLHARLSKQGKGTLEGIKNSKGLALIGNTANNNNPQDPRNMPELPPRPSTPRLDEEEIEIENAIPLRPSTPGLDGPPIHFFSSIVNQNGNEFADDDDIELTSPPTLKFPKPMRRSF